MILWAVPAVVLTVMALPLFLALRRAKVEAAALRAELVRLSGLRAAVESLGVEMGQLRAEVLRRRALRPGAPPAP